MTFYRFRTLWPALLLALLPWSPAASAQSYCPSNLVVWETPAVGQSVRAGAVITSSDWDQNFDSVAAMCRGEVWPGADDPPATCEPPQLFLDTDATADAMLLCCTATDTWEACGGGGGGGDDDQTAAEVPITDAGAFFTGADVEAALQEIGPTMDDARDPTAHAASHNQGGTDPISAEALASPCGAGATLEGDGAGGVQCGTDDGGGGALNDLTDVDTTGQGAGEALVYDGAQWEPSALPVCLSDGTNCPAGATAPTPGLLYVRDEKTSGTAGGTATAGAWNTRTLNTVVTNTITGASLASNAVTLPAGTYRIVARAPGYVLTEHRTRLRDTSGAVTLALGGSAFLGSESPSQSSNSWLHARITLASSTTFEFQQWVGAGRLSSTANLGNAASTGDAEVYAEVWIVDESGVTDDQEADEVPFTPAGSIAATDVQAALEEVASEAGGADDQTAAEVPYTPADGLDWGTDPDDAAEALDQLGARLTDEEAKADDDTPESGDFGAGVDLESDGSLSADVVAAAEMADADHGQVAWSGGVATVEGVQYGTAFPGSPATGDTFIVTDDSAAGECDSSAGSALTLCRYSGSAWEAVGDGGGGGGIGGSTGATDRAVLIANGTGGATVQASTATVDSSGRLRATGIGLNFTPAADGGLYFNRTGGDPFFTWYEDASGFGQIRGDKTTGSIYFADTTGVSATYFRVDTSGAGAGTTTISSLLSITPQASAPATCAIGDIYVDSSGALCACSVSNTWENAITTGSCS